MKRREFIGLVGGSTLLLPLRARSQQLANQNALALVAWLSSGRPDNSIEIFVRELSREGYSETRDYVLEKRFAGGDIGLLDSLAQEIVELKPRLIVAFPTSAGLAAKRATSSIPIVVPLALDAVRVGLVESLVRPGANVTGSTLIASDLVGKRLQLLRQILPSMRRLGMLSIAGVPQVTAPFLDAVRTATNALNTELVVAETENASDLDEAFLKLTSARAEALYVLESLALDVQRNRIFELANSHRMPIVSALKSYARAGALLSYGTDARDLFERAAGMSAKIMRGAKPHDIPMEQPNKFELAINLATAQKFSLTIPTGLIAIADEIIE